MPISKNQKRLQYEIPSQARELEEWKVWGVFQTLGHLEHRLDHPSVIRSLVLIT